MGPSADLAARWKRNREWTRRFFHEILTPQARLERPIALRHPFVFYEGHLAAFAVNTFLKRALGKPGIDPGLETLFERGIDPLDATGIQSSSWPERDRIGAYIRAADEGIAAVLESRMPAKAVEALLVILEHEEMHQETLLYMLHRLAYPLKREPLGVPPPDAGGQPPSREAVRIPAGRATLGAGAGEIPFGWDNEFPKRMIDVATFEMDVHPLTNASWLDFVDAGGYRDADLWTEEGFRWVTRERVEWPAFWTRHGDRWFWRAQFHEIPLPLAWPVFVSHAEASAYARWRGRRLPSEAEYHRAAFGRPALREAAFPWGDEGAGTASGNFGLGRWDPVPVGRFPAGASAWGIEDLVGNGWEWTSTPFAGFPGFRPMPLYPRYSADFFDGRHFVLKGASPATATPLVRRSFRNWFQPHYPFVYAKFRTVDA
jgi:iron(II)-dependent oxidoreductase